eukprot:1149981-Pelagomonas_calceolata.AAC.3
MAERAALLEVDHVTGPCHQLILVCMLAPGSSIPGDNPPCNTLFIGNLHEGVNEAELSAVFAASPGFRQLKVVRGRNTTAFVEYDSTENAMRAHDTHQVRVRGLRKYTGQHR